MYFMSVNATFAVAARTRKVSRRPCTCPTTGKILILHKTLRRPDDADRGCQTSPSRSSTYRRGDEIWPPRQTPGTLYSPLTGAGGGSVADWPMGQNLFLMSHPDVSLVNILLSITRVSLVQNKCILSTSCSLQHHDFESETATQTSSHRSKDVL